MRFAICERFGIWPPSRVEEADFQDVEDFVLIMEQQARQAAEKR